VTSREYVRRYFSDSARQWLARAYDDVDETAAYPVGAQRTRLALEAVVDRLGAVHGHLVDLGCGGGDLALRAADLGFRATGVDLAEGMIAEAQARRAELGPTVRDRVSFWVADVLETGLPTGSADAVTAIGLVEYLTADEPFLVEAARLLREGGVLIVSCRNRLFNATSGNDYTREEIEADAPRGSSRSWRRSAPTAPSCRCSERSWRACARCCPASSRRWRRTPRARASGALSHRPSSSSGAGNTRRRGLPPRLRRQCLHPRRRPAPCRAAGA